MFLCLKPTFPTESLKNCCTNSRDLLRFAERCLRCYRRCCTNGRCRRCRWCGRCGLSPRRHQVGIRKFLHLDGWTAVEKRGADQWPSTGLMAEGPRDRLRHATFSHTIVIHRLYIVILYHMIHMWLEYTRWLFCISKRFLFSASFASKTLATGPGWLGWLGWPGWEAIATAGSAAAPAAAPGRPATLVSELTPEDVENCGGPEPEQDRKDPAGLGTKKP